MKNIQTFWLANIRKPWVEVNERWKKLSEDGTEKSGKCLYIQVSSIHVHICSTWNLGHSYPREVMVRWKKHSRVLASIRKGPFVRNTVRFIRACRTDLFKMSMAQKAAEKGLPHTLSLLFHEFGCDVWWKCVYFWRCDYICT